MLLHWLSLVRECVEQKLHLLPDSNDHVCHSEQWGQTVFRMREKSMICRGMGLPPFTNPSLVKPKTVLC